MSLLYYRIYKTLMNIPRTRQLLVSYILEYITGADTGFQVRGGEGGVKFVIDFQDILKLKNGCAVFYQ